MKNHVTSALATMLLIALAIPAFAQPERNGVDVTWARDVEGATITLDGMLSEPEWLMAETIPLVWNQPHALPGSGQKIEGEPIPAEPFDGNDGTVYLLRDGNVLWVGVMAQDQSVGGGQSLWDFDGTIMSVLDRSQRPDTFATRDDANYFANGTVNAEFFTTWWNPADTTDETSTYFDGTPVGSGRSIPGAPIRLFGDYGVGFNEGNVDRPAEDIAVWDAVATVQGIANDDTHGPDTTYTIEMYIDLGLLGYDFSQEGGDKVAWNVALEDDDYSWPVVQDSAFLSRVWFQNQWGNNFNHGVAFIYGSPDVTVSSGDVPAVTDPEFSVYMAGSLGAPVVDGALDDAVWQEADTLFYIGYEQEPADAARNVGTLPEYHLSWFRPDINSDDRAALVIDPTVGMFQMTHADGILYIGFDTDDQAIAGIVGETGDGFRIQLRDIGATESTGILVTRLFDFNIDSTGAIGYSRDAAGIRDTLPDAVVAEAFLKGASTVADPSDVDEGYQIEVAIDLAQALGYAPAGKGQFEDNRIWISLNYFDGDYLEAANDSYSTRTWMLGERGQGAALYGYLNEQFGVAVEGSTEIPGSIELYGSYPNPFNPSTRMSYAIPTAGDVSIEVFSVLGRKVAELSPGLQSAGRHEVTFNAGELTSGIYFYRVALKSEGDVNLSRADRFVLVK